jgi:hypothetical protein
MVMRGRVVMAGSVIMFTVRGAVMAVRPGVRFAVMVVWTVLAVSARIGTMRLIPTWAASVRPVVESSVA